MSCRSVIGLERSTFFALAKQQVKHDRWRITTFHTGSERTMKMGEPAARSELYNGRLRTKPQTGYRGR